MTKEKKKCNENSETEKLINSLCKLHEDDLTKNIIKPLFESMGYDRVDFNGGPYERGRDLIALKSNPPSDKKYLVYIQTKKVKTINNKFSSSKMSNLIAQLRQCCTEKIQTVDGDYILADAIFLACPEQITNRLMEEVGNQLNSKPVIQFYDGPRILSDIKKFNPKLLDKLGSFNDKLLNSNSIEKNNNDLLLALRNRFTPKLENYYSDLSFYVGTFESNLLLNMTINVNQSKLKIDDNEWPLIKKQISVTLSKYNFSLIDKELSLIESQFKIDNSNYLTRSNQKLIKRKVYLVKLVATLKIDMENLRSELSKKQKELERGNRFSKVDFNLVPKQRINWLMTNSMRFYLEKKNLISLEKEIHDFNYELKKLSPKILEKPFYHIDLNIKQITTKFENLKKNYKTSIELINSKKIGFLDLKNFLQEVENTLSLFAYLLNQKLPIFKIISLVKGDNNKERIQISPHDVFQTGFDIAVYGGAGVGKTTTLLSYINKVTTNKIIYISLNSLVNNFKRFDNKTNDAQKNLLLHLILLNQKLDITQENISNLEVFLDSKITIVLDGLDEVYNSIPNIIEELSRFRKKYRKIQLIISSRDCVSYLKDIKILGITLLPFTKNQLNNFIFGWFGNESVEKAKFLVDFIKKKNLYQYISTPLLATITCSLIDKGVQPPNSENEIYSKRLRLLTGEYDLFKNVSRQKQDGELLRICARSIAFEMHKNSVRYMPKKDMIKKLIARLSNNYHESQLLECIEELINPCDILKLDPISNMFSFGHFRFQEHLASEEIKRNRNVDLLELVEIDWWNGALVLAAKEIDIVKLIEDVRDYGNYERSKFCLLNMVNGCYKRDRVHFKHLLKMCKDDYKMKRLYPDDEVY